MRSFVLTSTLVVAVALASSDARAQTGGNAAAAQALYDNATQEMDRKSYATACPKLEEVIRLLPDVVGARLTLGDCYQQLGKLASAWSAYAAAEATATRLGQTPRAEQGRAAAAALKPHLATLTIDVPADMRALPKLSVHRDGVDVGAAEWGVPIPIDRGAHTVDVQAEGKRPWSQAINVAQDGAASVVKVAPLAASLSDDGGVASQSVEPAPRRGVPGLAIAGFAIGGAGLITGVVAGAITLGKGCKANTCTASQLSGAKTTAWVSDIGFGVAVAGAAVGVVALVASSPKSGASAWLRVTPSRLALEGRF